MSANRKGLSVTERHVLRSVAIAVLFVLSGVLGHIPASVPYVKALMEWAGYSIVLPTVYENKHRPITDDERRMILETIPKHYAGTMVLTMLCCGLRPIEIRRMKWNWIDFENAILTVGKSKTEAGTGRKIPIPPVLLDALKEHKAKELNNEYVFVKYEKHTRMDDNAFYQSWKNFVKEMDLANGAYLYRNHSTRLRAIPTALHFLHRLSGSRSANQCGKRMDGALRYIGNRKNLHTYSRRSIRAEPNENGSICSNQISTS